MYAAIASIAASFGIDTPDVFTAGSAVAVVLKAALFGGAISNFLSHSIHNYFNPEAPLNISQLDQPEGGVRETIDDHWDILDGASPINCLSHEEREKVQDVVWLLPSARLSWPILKTSMLIGRIEDLFPNAKIRIFCNEGNSLIDCIATGPRTSVIHADMNAPNGYLRAKDELPEGAVAIDSGIGSVVSYPEGVTWLGLYGENSIQVTNDKKGIVASYTVERGYTKDPSKTDNRQGAYFKILRDSLRDIGLSEISDGTVPNLPEQQYSSTVKARIAELKNRFFPGKKPEVVFFNTSYGSGYLRGKRTEDDWFNIIESVLLKTNSSIIINKGDYQWQQSGADKTMEDLYARLRRAHPDMADRIIDIPSEPRGGNDMVRLMAVMALSDLVITENLGVTHLADFMGKPCASFMNPVYLKYISGNIQVIDDVRTTWFDSLDKAISKAGLTNSKSAFAPLSLSVWNKVFFFLPESWVRVAVGPALETIVAYPVCLASIAGWNAPAEWFINLHGGTDHQKEIRRQGLADMERGTLFGALAIGVYAAITSIAVSFGIDLPPMFTAGSAVAVVLKAALFGGAISNFLAHSIHNYFNPAASLAMDPVDIPAARPQVSGWELSDRNSPINSMSLEERKKVKRLVWNIPSRRLSWPLLNTSMLLGRIGELFPNAKISIFSRNAIVDCVALGDRVEVIKAATSDNERYSEAISQLEPGDVSIGLVDVKYVPLCRAGVNILEIQPGSNCVLVKNAAKAIYAEHALARGKPGQGMYFRTEAAALRELGFSEIPKDDVPVLRRDKYSEILKEKIRQIKQDHFAGNDKPVIFVNTFWGSGSDRDGRTMDDWFSIIGHVLKVSDANIVINQGDDDWEGDARDQVQALYARLREAFPDAGKRIIEIPSDSEDDIIRLAAVMAIADGIITEHSGVTHLADYLGKPCASFVVDGFSGYVSANIDAIGRSRKAWPADINKLLAKASVEARKMAPIVPDTHWEFVGDPVLNYLGPERRKAVKNVVWSIPNSRLSWPILTSAALIEKIETLFPNAQIDIYCNPDQSFIEGVSFGARVRVIRAAEDDANGYNKRLQSLRKGDMAIVSGNSFQEYPAGVYQLDIAFPYSNSVLFTNNDSNYDRVIAGKYVHGKKGQDSEQGAYNRQMRAALSGLGFSELAAAQAPVLRQDRYSEKLKSKIVSIRQQYFAGNEDKPKVFFNTSYGTGQTRGDRSIDDWIRLIEQVLRTTDACIFINKGDETWRAQAGGREMVDSIYSYLRNRHPDAASRIVEIPSDDKDDIIRLMSVVALSDLVITENSGVTHLADFMGKPCASFVDPAYARYVSGGVAVIKDSRPTWKATIEGSLVNAEIQPKNVSAATAPLSLNVWNKIFFFLPESWVRVAVGPAIETVIAFPVSIASLAGWEAPSEWFINLHGGTDHQKEIRRQGLADMRRGTLFGAAALGAYAIAATIASHFGIDVPNSFTAGSAVAVILKSALFGGIVSPHAPLSVHQNDHPHRDTPQFLDPHWIRDGSTIPLGIMSLKSREKITEVIWDVPSDRLSYPLLTNALLVGRIEELFPNAKIKIYCNPKQSIIDSVAAGSRTEIIPYDAADARKYARDVQNLKPGGVFIYSGSEPEVRFPLGVATLNLDDGTHLSFSNTNRVSFAKFEYDREWESDPEGTDKEQGAHYKNIATALNDLGFSEISAENAPVLSKDKYSDSLKQKIGDIKEQYLKANEGRPVIFVNPFYNSGRTRKDRTIDDWFNIIGALLRKTDACVVINKGDREWERGPAGAHIQELYMRLRAAFPDADKRIVEIPSDDQKDLTRLMAVVALSDAVITENSGVTHLADFLGTPCASFAVGAFLKFFSKRIEVLDDSRATWDTGISQLLTSVGIKTDGPSAHKTGAGLAPQTLDRHWNVNGKNSPLNCLSVEEREKINTVYWALPSGRLSWPLLDASVLIGRLETLFPNAREIRLYCNRDQSLVDCVAAGQHITVIHAPEEQFLLDAQKLGSGAVIINSGTEPDSLFPGGVVVLNISGDTDLLVRADSKQVNARFKFDIGPGEQGAHYRLLAGALSDIGFTGIPQEAAPRLDESGYSEVLKEKITQIQEQITETGNGDRPLVLINPYFAGGFTRADRTIDDWVDIVADIVRNSNACVVINGGDGFASQRGVQRLYGKLREVLTEPETNRIVRIPSEASNDIIRVTAVTALSKLVITEGSGVSHLADYLGKPCASFMDPVYRRYFSNDVTVIENDRATWRASIHRSLKEAGVTVNENAEIAPAPLSLKVWNKIFFFLPESWVRVAVGPAIETVIAFPISIASLIGWDAPAEWFINLHGGTDYQKEIRRRGLADMRRGTLFGALVLGAYAAIALIANSFGIDLPNIFTAGSALAVILKAAFFGGSISNFLSHSIHNYFNPAASLNMVRSGTAKDSLDSHWSPESSKAINFMNAERREKVTEIVWAIPYTNLSWPLLYSATLLIGNIEELFPNAQIRLYCASPQSIIDCIDMGKRTKIVRVFENTGSNYLGSADNIKYEFIDNAQKLAPGSMAIFIGDMLDAWLPDGVNALAISDKIRFTNRSSSSKNSISATYVFSSEKHDPDGKDYQQGAFYDQVAGALRVLGFSQIPADTPPLLTQNRYSAALTGKMSEIKQKYLQGDHDRPMVLFNPYYSKAGFTRQGRTIDDWFNIIEQVLQTTDSYVVVNRGHYVDETAKYDIDRLFERLREAHPNDPRIVDIPSDTEKDIVRLAAVVALSNAVITENAGVTHLADFMGKPCLSFAQDDYKRYFSRKVNILDDGKSAWPEQIGRFLAGSNIRVINNDMSETDRQVPLQDGNVKGGKPLYLPLWDRLPYFGRLPYVIKIPVALAIETLVTLPASLLSLLGDHRLSRWFIHLHGADADEEAVLFDTVKSMGISSLFSTGVATSFTTGWHFSSIMMVALIGAFVGNYIRHLVHDIRFPPERTYEVEGYTLQKLIHHGGFGAVFLARQHATGRLVAIKIADLHKSNKTGKGYRGKAEAALERERAFLLETDRPDIVRIVDRETTHTRDGTPCLILEFIKGPTLEEWSQKNGYADNSPQQYVRDCLHIALQFTDTMRYMHEDRRVVHRDIRPDNVMLVNAAGADGTVDLQGKVIDFGIVKELEGKPEEGWPNGTIGYIAPERFSSGETDTRSDIYSFGILLLELLGRESISVDNLTGLPRLTPAFAAMNRTLRHVSPELSVKIRQIIEGAVASIDQRTFDDEILKRQITAALVLADRPDGRYGIAGYTLGKTIAHGGLAVVDKAVDEKTGALVAAKIAEPGDQNGQAPGMVKRAREEMERERSVLLDTDREDFIHIADKTIVATEDGTPCEMLEYVNGLRLSEWLELPREGQDHIAYVRCCLDIAMQLCNSLTYLHETRHIVHRDLAPKNVMLVLKRDERGALRLQEKLMDLGSHYGVNQIDPDELIVGTPGYLASERPQKGAIADPRSDIYALGVSLIAMLSGKPIVSDTMVADSATTTRQLQEALAGLPPQLQQAITLAIAHATSPIERRTGTAAAMKQELGGIMNLLSPQPEPVQPGYPVIPGFTVEQLLKDGEHAQEFLAKDPQGGNCIITVAKDLTEESRQSVADKLKVLQHPASEESPGLRADFALPDGRKCLVTDYIQELDLNEALVEEEGTSRETQTPTPTLQLPGTKEALMAGLKINQEQWNKASRWRRAVWVAQAEFFSAKEANFLTAHPRKPGVWGTIVYCTRWLGIEAIRAAEAFGSVFAPGEYGSSIFFHALWNFVIFWAELQLGDDTVAPEPDGSSDIRSANAALLRRAGIDINDIASAAAKMDREWLLQHKLFLSGPDFYDDQGQKNYRYYLSAGKVWSLADIEKRIYDNARIFAGTELQTKAEVNAIRREAKNKKQMKERLLKPGGLFDLALRGEFLITDRETRAGKLFGKIDISAKSFEDWPLWPVDENGKIQEKLLEWLIKKTDPPAAYYMAKKTVSIAELRKMGKLASPQQTKNTDSLAAQASQPAAQEAPREVLGSKDETQPSYSGPAANEVFPEVDGYEISRNIHSSDYSSVYDAYKKDTGQRVALKITFDKEFTGKIHSPEHSLKIEGDFLASADRPGIPKLVGRGKTTAGFSFIATEYVDWPGMIDVIHKKVKEGKPLTERDVLEIMINLAKEIQYVHNAHHQVYMDLKPGQIKLNPAGNNNIQLLDFGLLFNENEAQEDSEKHVPMVFGTPGYMCTEQMKSAPADKRFDIYGLARVMLDLLVDGVTVRVTGEGVDETRALQGALGYIMRKRKNMPIPLREAITGIIMHAMAPINKRTPDTETFIAELTRALALTRPAEVPAAPDEHWKVSGGRSPKNSLSLEEREKVSDVVWNVYSSNLSWPLLNIEMLIGKIEELFPHAHIRIYCDPKQSIVDGIALGKRTRVIRYDLTSGANTDYEDDINSLNPGSVAIVSGVPMMRRYPDGVNVVTIAGSQPNMVSVSNGDAVRKNALDSKYLFGTDKADRHQGAYRSNVGTALRYLGLSEIGEQEAPRLEKDNYSVELKGKIAEIKNKHFGGREPKLVFFNTAFGSGATRAGRTTDDWFAMIEKVLQETDASIVINKGDDRWKNGARNSIDDLYDRLRAAHANEPEILARIVEVPSDAQKDIIRLMAVVSLSSLVITENSGVTHLASFMGKHCASFMTPEYLQYIADDVTILEDAKDTVPASIERALSDAGLLENKAMARAPLSPVKTVPAPSVFNAGVRAAESVIRSQIRADNLALKAHQSLVAPEGSSWLQSSPDTKRLNGKTLFSVNPDVNDIGRLGAMGMLGMVPVAISFDPGPLSSLEDPEDVPSAGGNTMKIVLKDGSEIDMKVGTVKTESGWPVAVIHLSMDGKPVKYSPEIVASVIERASPGVDELRKALTNTGIFGAEAGSPVAVELCGDNDGALTSALSTYADENSLRLASIACVPLKRGGEDLQKVRSDGDNMARAKEYILNVLAPHANLKFAEAGEPYAENKDGRSPTAPAVIGVVPLNSVVAEGVATDKLKALAEYAGVIGPKGITGVMIQGLCDDKTGAVRSDAGDLAAALAAMQARRTRVYVDFRADLKDAGVLDRLVKLAAKDARGAPSVDGLRLVFAPDASETFVADVAARLRSASSEIDLVAASGPSEILAKHKIRVENILDPDKAPSSEENLWGSIPFDKVRDGEALGKILKQVSFGNYKTVSVELAVDGQPLLLPAAASSEDVFAFIRSVGALRLSPRSEQDYRAAGYTAGSRLVRCSTRK